MRKKLLIIIILILASLGYVGSGNFTVELQITQSNAVNHITQIVQVRMHMKDSLVLT